MAASLFQGAKAEVILPHVGFLDLQSPSSQRSSVFLDEVLDVFVLLHTICNEETLKESLSRLSITLETHATGTPVRRQGADKGPQSNQVTELVSRCDVDITQDPITAISSSRTTLAWTTQIHIGLSPFPSAMTAHRLTLSDRPHTYQFTPTSTRLQSHVDTHTLTSIPSTVSRPR